MTGKEACARLREIRNEIAVQNGFEPIPETCTHQGDCPGTCPKCGADFLRAFIRLVNGRWRVRAETSLHVPPENAVLPLDEYIVDIKDLNPATYHAYTGGNAALAHENLAAALRAGSADRVLARVPLIPDFNTEADVQKSVEALRAMGVTRVDPFRYLRKEA